ncbi:Prp21p [Sporobolomyces koalae]|uniref:Prp21p n=1 Tax=Sporobolomyces koalae TaxID=500713 RepID=UPI003182775F
MAETATPAPDATIILPPPAIKTIVDKTAAFIAPKPNAAQLEERFRQREQTDSRFSFLNPTNPYYAYYADRLAAFKAGEQPEVKADDKADPTASGPAEEDDGRPKEPPALEFLVEDPPKISAVDLDILRLTALFAARSGAQFTRDLAGRESRNYQFDFLRPSHSLFGYFNRLVEQYTKILLPSKELRNRIERRAGGASNSTADRVVAGRREVLKDAHERVEWEKWESSRRKEEEDKVEAERIAFAEIDWQDFKVASTIEFTESDEAGLAELPPPMSLSEVENMTLAQKKMNSIIIDGGEPEADENGQDEQEMEMDDDDDDEPAAASEPKAEDKVEAPTLDVNLPVKIRKDYVRNKKEKTSQAYTTFDGQQVPVEEFSKHVRYELLDPRWKEEKKQAELNRSAANLLPGGTDVSASIRAMAAHRPDIFGDSPGDKEFRRQAEELAKSRAREKDVWDGHAASRESITNRYQATANLDEQIEALHRAKHLVGAEDGAEPRIGPAAPAIVPVPAAPVAPQGPTTLTTGASISAGPTPADAFFAAPPPQSFGDYPQTAPIPLPAGLPQRPNVVTPGEALPGTTAGTEAAQQSSTTRPAEEEPEDERSAKRAKVEGQVVPEQEWLASHPDPVKIGVQLPDYPAKPAWGCDGKKLELEVPLTLLVGTIRDRIAAMVGLPVGKQKFTYNGRILANSTTLAALNIDNGNVLHVSIKEKK